MHTHSPFLHLPIQLRDTVTREETDVQLSQVVDEVRRKLQSSATTTSQPSAASESKAEESSSNGAATTLV